MKRFLPLIIFVGFIFTVIFFTVIVPKIDQQDDYARITELDYTAVITDNAPGDKGKVVITERLTFDIHAASSDNGFWELWRDLPESTVDGERITYKVLSVKRLTTNGQPDYLEFTNSGTLYIGDYDYINTSGGFGPNKWYHSKGPYDGEYNYECVLFYVDGLYREKVVFEIEYEMLNASFRYADCSELYLSLYSGSDTKYLESLKAEIRFPLDKMPAAGNYEAHTFGTKSETFGFTESDSLNAGYHTFSFELNKQQLEFKPYNQYIEFLLVSFGEDKHSFTQYASINDYYYDNVLQEVMSDLNDYHALPEKYKSIKTALVIIMSILAAGIIAIVFIADRNCKKKHKFLKAEQEYPFYREIPSKSDVLFAGAITMCKHNKSDIVKGAYAAVLLGLVQKRYLSVDKIDPSLGWEDYNIKLTLATNIFDTQTGAITLKPLSPSEELFLTLLRRHATPGGIALSAFERKITKDYENTASFVDRMNDVATSEGYAKGYIREFNYKKVRNSYDKPAIALIVFGIIAMLINLTTFMTRVELAFGAFFILGVGFIISAVILKLLSRKYVLLTQYGENEYSKWRGLYNFFKNETLLKEREVQDLAIWEEYLIYATAMGIPEKIIKAIEVNCPDTDLIKSSPILYHPYFRTRAFTIGYVRSVSRSAGTAHTASRLGGGGGGGGYGGGGRGGGGGGGGH